MIFLEIWSERSLIDIKQTHVGEVFYFKVSEHSFQVPMPNFTISSKLFMLWRPFSTRVMVNHRSVYSRILARVCAVAMTTGLVKNKAYFKKVQS